MKQAQTKITTQTVGKIANLARITEEPLEQFLQEYTEKLSIILDHAEELKNIDTSGVQPISSYQTTTIKDLREDKPTIDQKSYQEVRKRIIQNFPQSQENMLVVDAVL